jgi:hypothetical protein
LYKLKHSRARKNSGEKSLFFMVFFLQNLTYLSETEHFLEPEPFLEPEHTSHQERAA